MSREPLFIQLSLQPEEVMKVLRDGYGYSWSVLRREPMLIATGRGRKGHTPDVALVGKTLILRGEDEEYQPLFKRVFQLLERTAGRSLL